MRNLLFPILLFLGIVANAQDTIEVNYVTINPTGPNVTISWKPSPNLSGIDGYIICQYGKTPGHGLDYNFFVGKVTSYTFQFDTINRVPVQFAVLSYSGTQSNIIDRSFYKRPIHRTMHATLAYDSCSSEIKMTWTHYIGWGTDLTGYQIINDDSNQQVASVGPGDSTYTFTGVDANRTYRYHVRAIHKNGTYTSNSNFASIYTKALNPPGFINVRNVEVMQNASAQITFYIDPTTQLHNYRLVRSNKPYGGFQVVNEYTGHTASILTATDQSLGDSTMYYKLQSLNNCNGLNMVSNLASIIAPKYAISGQQIEISWDAYMERPYGIREYRLFRSIGNEPATQITATLNTRYTDDLSVLSGQQLSGNVCYFIESVSNPDGTGNVYKATSKTICVDVASQIFIPQAFTPNSDGQNDEFKPSFAFLPADYTMIIYNRNGSKVFETNLISDGWNGMIKSGIKAPEGSYIYFISFTTSGGKRIEKKGSLTVIYP